MQFAKTFSSRKRVSHEHEHETRLELASSLCNFVTFLAFHFAVNFRQKGILIGQNPMHLNVLFKNTYAYLFSCELLLLQGVLLTQTLEKSMKLQFAELFSSHNVQRD